MARFLADENIPVPLIDAARLAGFDLAWIGEVAPGADDYEVLERSCAESRVLITFDKDFGDIAFNAGADASCGVILIRPKRLGPDELTALLLKILGSDLSWTGRFAVVDERRIRMRSLPRPVDEP